MLNISTFESDFLQIRIARYDVDVLTDDIILAIQTDAIEQNIDVIRLKVDASVQASHLLEKLSFPYSFSGGISEYIFKVDYQQHTDSKQKLIFVEIQKNDLNMFKDFFYQTFNEHDIGYHNAPYLVDIVSKKSELDCLYEYYASYVERENHHLIFLKKDDNLIGFTTIQPIGEGMVTLPITGILPKFRSKGLYYELCESYIRYMYDRQLICIFSSRNENNIARQVYSSFAFKHYGSKYNYNITPLLNKNILAQKIEIKDYTFTEIEDLLKDIKQHVQSVVKLPIRLKNYRNYFHKNFDKNRMCTLTIHQPFSSSSSTLFVCKITDTHNISSIIWLEYEYC